MNYNIALPVQLSITSTSSLSMRVGMIAWVKGLHWGDAVLHFFNTKLSAHLVVIISVQSELGKTHNF